MAVIAVRRAGKYPACYRAWTLIFVRAIGKAPFGLTARYGSGDLLSWSLWGDEALARPRDKGFAARPKTVLLKGSRRIWRRGRGGGGWVAECRKERVAGNGIMCFGNIALPADYVGRGGTSGVQASEIYGYRQAAGIIRGGCRSSPW